MGTLRPHYHHVERLLSGTGKGRFGSRLCENVKIESDDHNIWRDSLLLLPYFVLA
jgi:hypothetical protein